MRFVRNQELVSEVDRTRRLGGGTGSAEGIASRAATPSRGGRVAATEIEVGVGFYRQKSHSDPDFPPNSLGPEARAPAVSPRFRGQLV